MEHLLTMTQYVNAIERGDNVENNISGSVSVSEKENKTKLDIAMSITKIVVFVVFLLWLVCPQLEEYQDGGNKAWRAPSYIVVSYNLPIIDCNETNFYLFPGSMMSISEIWDKYEKDRYDISWEEILQKEYEQAVKR